jgi:hypothetical protein
LKSGGNENSLFDWEILEQQAHPLMYVSKDLSQFLDFSLEERERKKEKILSITSFV